MSTANSLRDQKANQLKVLVMPSTMPPDGTYYQDGFTFVIANGVATMTAAEQTAGELLFPAVWFAYGIGADILGSDASDLTGGLVIPATVTSIGDTAFYAGADLTSVSLPESLLTIGVGSFSDCAGLALLVLPASLTSVGSGAFSNCTDLVTVYTRSLSTVFNSAAFYGCTALTKIYYAPTVTPWANPWNGIPTAEWTNYPAIP